MLIHARAATNGSPQISTNNHPFLNKDKTVAVIHNGKFSDISYELLKNKYYPESECDSELFLKIIEKNNFLCLKSFKEIWTYYNEISMALAIGKKSLNSNSIWISRNDARPLWVFDLTRELGQIFFCSNVDIFTCAIQTLKAEKILNNIKCCEFPSNEIWRFSINEKKESYSLDKYKVLFENKNKKINDKNETILELFSDIKSLNDKLKNSFLSKISVNESLDCNSYATHLLKIRHDLKVLINKL